MAEGVEGRPAWLADLPTVELHRHFEAGLSPECLARLATRHGVGEARTRAGVVLPGVDPQDPASIRRYYREVAEGFAEADGFPRFADSFGLPLSLLELRRGPAPTGGTAPHGRTPRAGTAPW